MERLEPRRLFASDLALLEVSVNDPFSAPESQNVRSVRLTNLGNESFQGEIQVQFIYTTDRIIGNADDIAGDDVIVPRIIGPNGQGQLGPNIISTPGPALTPSLAVLPVGKYFLAATITANSGVDARSDNNSLVGDDFEVYTGQWPSASISGTSGNDVILLASTMDGQAVVSVNGETHASPNVNVFIDGAEGDDKIVTLEGMVSGLLITGSGGRDTIIGSDQHDSISGGNGRDKVFGGAGDDNILGGAQGDWLFGDGFFIDGDRITFAGGNDTVRGAGGNDRITDSIGTNYLLGGSGDDLIFCRSTETLRLFPDSVSGGTGYDRAEVDDRDGRASIEELLP